MNHMDGFPHDLRTKRNGGLWLSLENFGRLSSVDKHEHAERLRNALRDHPGARQQIADAVGKSYRTIGNWTSADKPSMPSAAERAVIRTIVGDYDEEGDAVERAVRKSPLIKWRQDRVISVYEEHLHDQRREEAG